MEENITLLNQKGAFFYFKKGVLVFFEFLSFTLSLLFLVGLFWIPSDPITFKEEIDQSTSVITTLHFDQVSLVMDGLRVVLVVIIILLLTIGVLFGYIRRKNNKIRKASKLLEDLNDRTL